MQKLKDIFIPIMYVSFSFLILYIIFFRMLKFDINNCINYVYVSLTILTSIGLIAVPWIIFFIQHKYNKNKLFSEILSEYSDKKMGQAIRRITDFIKFIGQEIEPDDIDDIKNEKKIEICYNYKKLKDGKIKFIESWDDLDFKRRMIANYFVKINILCEKNLIDKKIITEYWSSNSLSYLANYIITLEYFALPIVHEKHPILSMNPPKLIDFYNKYIIEQELEIKKKELKKEIKIKKKKLIKEMKIDKDKLIEKIYDIYIKKNNNSQKK